MSSTLAGPSPRSLASFRRKVKLFEHGAWLVPATGPVVGSLELLTKKLPRNLATAKPNVFNPVPGPRTIRRKKTKVRHAGKNPHEV